MESSMYIVGMINLFIPIVLGILLIILVIFGIIFINNLIKITKKLDSTVDRFNTSLDLTNQSLQKAQAPLETLVKISHTVDSVHDAGLTAFKNTRDYLADHIIEIKDKIHSGIEGIGTFVKNKNNNKGETKHE